MFTGVIKLSNLDDYISPGQSCTKPKVIKPDPVSAKATVSLADCLACSGCLTSAQSVLIQRMSVDRFHQQIGSNKKLVFLLSHQSLFSLAGKFKMDPNGLMCNIRKRLKSMYKSTMSVLTIRWGIDKAHQLIWEQFQRRQGPIICSQCPGWVCYAEKTLPQSVTGLMSCIKSPQQLMGIAIRSVVGDCYIISVTPCYDKKLEATRFTTPNGDKEVDLVLSTVEFQTVLGLNWDGKLAVDQQNGIPNRQLHQIDIIPDSNVRSPQALSKQGEASLLISNSHPITIESKEQLTQQLQTKMKQMNLHSNGLFQEQQCIKLPQDSTSNGYLKLLLSKLQATVNHKNLSVTSQSTNSDLQSYQIVSCPQWPGYQKAKLLRCYGFKNIQKTIQSIKKGKSDYKYIEMMACPGGCYGGGGQIKLNNQRPRDVVDSLKQTAKDNERVRHDNHHQEQPEVVNSSNINRNVMSQNPIKQERQIVQSVISQYYHTYKSIPKSHHSTIVDW